MTKILESLSAFEGKSINQLEMKNVMGGIKAATGGGSVCTSTAVCSTGCMAYSSDSTSSSSPSGYSEYYGSHDINQSC